MLNRGSKQQSFVARVGATGQLRRVDFASERFLQHFLRTQTNIGDKITVMISTAKAKRTLNQNSYYFGVYLPLIADETGEDDIEALHELFKGKFLTKEIKEIIGEKVRIKKSTTDLSVPDFINYIMEIERFTGIVAPDTRGFDLAPLR